MNFFTGEIAGLLMIILIMILGIKLLAEMVNKKIGNFFEKYKKVMLTSLLLGIFQMMVAGLIVTLLRERVSVFQLDKVWNLEWMKEDVTFLENFSYQGLFLNGRFPLYYLIVHCLSVILFHATKQCMMYVGLLAGVVTFTSYFIINAQHRELMGVPNEMDLSSIIWCLPGSFFIFLPSSFSLSLAFVSVFYVVWNHGRDNKWLSLILAFISASTHLIGFLPLCMMIVGKIISKEKMGYVISFSFMMIQLLLSLMEGLVNIYEVILSTEIVMALFFIQKKKKVSYATETYATIFMTLVNGMWMMLTLNVI